jgi:hypothetical protein
MEHHMDNAKTTPAKSSTLAVIAAWLVVTIPAAWGVSQTIHKSLALFTSPPATTTQPAPVSPRAP